MKRGKWRAIFLYCAFFLPLMVLITYKNPLQLFGKSHYPIDFFMEKR